MAVKKARFLADLKKLSKVCLDTSVPIYHLEDIEPYAELTEALFILVARASLTAVCSTISLTELLTKPFAEEQLDRVALCEQFIRSFASLELVAPGLAISREAARLRGKYKLRTPDTLLAATALHEKADALVTNDAKLRKLRAENVKVLLLDDYV